MAFRRASRWSALSIVERIRQGARWWVISLVLVLPVVLLALALRALLF